MIRCVGYGLGWHKVELPRYELAVEATFWLEEHPSDYSYYIHSNYRYISFESEADALLYTLKWLG